jgi:hypothetical protein
VAVEAVQLTSQAQLVDLAAVVEELLAVGHQQRAARLLLLEKVQQAVEAVVIVQVPLVAVALAQLAVQLLLQLLVQLAALVAQD